jgi:hypothetical protein
MYNFIYYGNFKSYSTVSLKNENQFLFDVYASIISATTTASGKAAERGIKF